MATLVLQTAGSLIGGAIGGPLGAMAGRALGGLAGATLDQAWLGSSDSPRMVEGPRLTEMRGLGSTEGAPIPRVYGRARIGGELIWATRFEEEATTTVSRTPRRGAKGAPASPRRIETAYAYYANLAVALCEGPVGFVRRVWADGREIDQNTIVMRLHRGDEGQAPDPLILAKEGAGNAPAYRGLAYVVFERLPLESFGNRIPQFTFEVIRPVAGLASLVRAVCLIPGATEFGYAPWLVTRTVELGVTRPENRHELTRSFDLRASLDALQALCPNLETVSVVVSWFGDDLRAGECRIAPRVEDNIRATDGPHWQVGPLTRLDAQPVSRVTGAPAYGGTPSDAAVLGLIGDLKARGLSVVLYPFVMMDVPGGNARPDPWTGAANQPAYPWRGRITCHPAPDRPGSPDGTATAADQVAAFFGMAMPANVSAGDGHVAYSGPDEWRFRRHILHYAQLATMAGGVAGFILGSELVGLTRVRSAPGTYPAAAALADLAGDVRAILGPDTAITYAADWTEYGAHVRQGGAEVRFPLDPLWASPAIDAVGIDFYPPISDWRDGLDHADLAEARAIHDVAYLRTRIAAGEAFDWYYASPANRAAQIRTPITDGAYGKPWIHRAKDLLSWWSQPHRERAGGVELPSPTGWIPQGKPIWLTEIGVPAVDKGPNGPNVFPDPKSSENALPPFSRGGRDDLVQARALVALLSRFDPAAPDHPAGANPVSSVYGGRMVDPARVFVWAWDARPFPAFPDLTSVWSDGANWETGHWLNGRLEGVPLDRLVAALAADHGLPEPDVAELDGFVDGYVIDRPMSARDAIEPLLRAFGADAVASAGTMRFRGRTGRAVATLSLDDAVPDRDGSGIQLVRGQESELPRELRLTFTDGEGDYRRRAVASRRLAGAARRESAVELPAILRPAEAQRLADIRLQDLWAARETLDLALSPRRVDLEVGDVIALDRPDAGRRWRITRIVDGAERRITARAVEPAVYETPAPVLPRPARPTPAIAGRPAAIVLDLPAAYGDPPGLQWIAACADPWPGALTVWRSTDGTSFAPHAGLSLPALIGTTLDTLPPGPLWRWDAASAVTIRLRGGGLASVDDAAALAGANTLAVRGADGLWEILSAARVDLVAPDTFRLSRLIRGLAGSEPAVSRAVPAGAPVVVLDAAVVPLASALADLGRPYRYRIGPAGRDPADPSMVALEATAGTLALRPFAPVRVSARRQAAGIDLAFLRRTRIDGDAWDLTEVPLGEAESRFAIDILEGSDVRRTLTGTASPIRYAAADELADFGAPQASLSLTIAQIGATIGRGFPATLTVPVL